jgi:hypothetical protein
MHHITNPLEQHIMQFDHYEYRISSHYLSALINGDESGLSDTEAQEFNEWLESTDRRISHWDVTDHGDNFTRCEVTGLHADCATVRGYFSV